MALSPFAEILASGIYTPAAGPANETFDIQTRGRSGLVVFSSVTALAGGQSQTITIRQVDEATNLTATAALATLTDSATGFHLAQIHPAGQSPVVPALLTARIRITVAHSSVDPITRTLSYQLTA